MKWLASVVVLLVIAMGGCSKDSGGGNPFGPGGGNTGGVTWTIGTRQGAQGTIFTAQPSAAVTVNSVTVSLPAQQFQDVVNDNGTTVYQPGNAYDISEYTGVASGQQWVFVFTGKIGSAQGQSYSVTSNYNVP